MNLRRIFRSPLTWIVLAVIAIGLLIDFSQRVTSGFKEAPTSQVVSIINGNEPLSEVILIDKEQEIRVTLKDANHTGYKATWVGNQSDQLIPRLNQRVADKTLDQWKGENATPGFFSSLLGTLIPFIIIGVLFFFLLNSVQGGGSRVMQFGKSKAKIANKDTPKTTFRDVAGCEEAIEELEEIKEFLAEPAKFQAVGAKIPKGVLLYGPPGTGKTLLARAVAGEAGVPFFSISGSDFVEMFVGVGASRVRDLFEQAKANAPAIVFVDEIDAVGRHRGAGLGGGHDEREQTLNQLLVEMDGFDVKTNVILIAATNRPDILDPALLRPGRFDRQIAVDAPDMLGRHRILEVHAQGKPVTADVDLLAVARRTPGFTGADLANVLNEAALLTARTDKKLIDDEVLDEAIDRVIAGPQKRTRIMSAKERKITAYHEGGHALVAAALNHTDPVTKVTILPRGRALGYTMVMPIDDKYSTTRNEILDQLAYALGGRVAEEIVFHEPTTGASNDIEKATGMARKMVTEFGMSERVGAIKLGQSNGEVFLGRDMGHQRDYSEEIAGVVDEEVRKLIENAHDEAWHVINDNRDVLDRLVLDLLEKETLNAAELAEMFQDIRKRPLRPTWLSSAHRTLSDLPPVLTPAEQAAANGHNGVSAPPGATITPPDPGTAAAIDKAAENGADPRPEENPPTK